VESEPAHPRGSTGRIVDSRRNPEPSTAPHPSTGRRRSPALRQPSADPEGASSCPVVVEPEGAARKLTVQHLPGRDRDLRRMLSALRVEVRRRVIVEGQRNHDCIERGDPGHESDVLMAKDRDERRCPEARSGRGIKAAAHRRLTNARVGGRRPPGAALRGRPAAPRARPGFLARYPPELPGPRRCQGRRSARKGRGRALWGASRRTLAPRDRHLCATCSASRGR